MKLISAALLSILPLLPVQAQQQNSITLSCNGTIKLMTAGDNIKPEPVTGLGIIVNLSERVVAFSGYTVPIKKADSTRVSFDGLQPPSYRGMKPFTITGIIDRVTGAASVSFFSEQVEYNQTWELVCHPATRLF